MSSVFAWFLIYEIRRVKYNNALFEQFGERTFLRCDGSAVESGVSIPKRVEMPSRDTILHLSDMHFGADYGFRPPETSLSASSPDPSLCECLLDDLKQKGLADKIAAIVITGDFVTKAGWTDKIRAQIVSELKNICVELNISSESLILVPGNHDIRRFSNADGVKVEGLSLSNQVDFSHEMEYPIFRNVMKNVPIMNPINELFNIRLGKIVVDICALNSCGIVATRWTEYGYVGEGGYDVIRKLKNKSRGPANFRIIALHHHLLPVTAVDGLNEHGVSLTLDAAKLLDLACKADVIVALHGHQHIPRLVRYENIGESIPSITVVAGGSVSVKRERLPGAERNAYGILRFSQTGLSIEMRELRNDGKPNVSLYAARIESK
jgi:predicted phosphodiesterase